MVVRPKTSGAVVLSTQCGDQRAEALAPALLEAADLRGACLASADFTAAEFNGETLWPIGFAPATRGAIRLP